MDHKISVIIPAKNEEHLIGLLLDSLAQQDCAKELEVVLADAHSTDRTRAITASYEPAFRAVRIVDGGLPGAGRNMGARAASGDLLVFIDADLILPRTDFIRQIEAAFKERSLVIATVYLKPISTRRIDHMLVGACNVLLMLVQKISPHGSMCIIATRTVFEQTGGYPEDVVMSEDHDFLRAASKFGRFGIIPLHALMSVRRLDKEGRWRISWKYVYAVYYRIIYGPMKEPLFDYEYEYD